MATYQVVILGLKLGQNRDEALQRLAATFKQPVERLSTLVSGTRAVVKRGTDIALAAKLQAAIEAAGFECVVEPEVGDTSKVPAADVSRDTVGTSQSADALMPQSAPPLANSVRSDSTAAERLASDVAPKDKWQLFRHVTRNFGWGHWAATAFVLIALVGVLAKLPSLFVPTPSTREAATSSSRSQDDARLSPSEQLILALANTQWSCTLNESKQVEILFIVNVARDGTEPGASKLVAIGSIESPTKATPFASFMWFWKSKLDSTVLGKDLSLSDDEIAIMSLGANPVRWSVLRAKPSQDGSYLSLVERGTAVAFTCDIVLLANSKKHKYETDKEIRSMLLKTRSEGPPRSSTAPTVQPTSIASSSSSPTAAEAYQSMERHQNNCKVRGSIKCFAACEAAKSGLVNVVEKVSLNPQLPTPPKLQGVVDQYRMLCLSQTQ